MARWSGNYGKTGETGIEKSQNSKIKDQNDNSKIKKIIHPEYQYLDLLQDILDNGIEKRYGVQKQQLRVFLVDRIRFDLSQGFPLLTTKKVFLRGIIHELLWFISGNSNIKYLVDNKVHIWDEWGYKVYLSKSKDNSKQKLTQTQYIQKIKETSVDNNFVKKYGDLGPVYGVQWRKWPTKDSKAIDQLGWVINKLKSKSPYRKHFVVSAWNPEYIYEMAKPGESVVLPPCHTIFHFNATGNKLSLQLYQRSADVFLGVPFNIASYALLLMMVAQVTGFEPGDFVHTFGDVHIYSNHFDQVKEQIKRKPKKFPIMRLNPKIKKIDEFTFSDFEIQNYNPHSPIKADITVVGGF